MPKKSRVSIPKNQTNVIYTDDEMVTFKDNMVTKDTKNKQTNKKKYNVIYCITCT